MVSEWRLVTWGELATLEYGKGIRGYNEVTSGYRVYGTNGPIGWHHAALYDQPSVIIGRKGAYRGVHYASEPFFVIDTAFYLKPKINMDVRWAYYALLTQDINSMDSGSAIPSTSREAFYKLRVKQPSLAEQKAIAEVLSALDDKIELNRKMNETLEGIAQALFKNWFVDFDPVRAKMEGRQPEGLSPEIAALFPDKLVDSPLGSIPEGWRIGSLENIARLEKPTINPGKFPGEVFFHHSLPSYDLGRWPVKERGSEIKSNKTVVSSLNSSVLLSKLNPETPRVWFVHPDEEYRAICSTEFLVFVGKEDISNEYLYCMFRDDKTKSLLEGMVTGTSKSHQRVQPKSILKLPCTIPPSVLLKHFKTTIACFVERDFKNREQGQNLTQLRDLLLPKLISGELRVKEAISSVQEAL